MKPSRTWLVWAAFAICAATILGAMTWQTRNALDSEHDRLAAESRADLQEKMRLALWRMDSLGATLILEDDADTAPDFVKNRFEWKANGQLTLPNGTPAPVDLQRAITQSGAGFEACFAAIVGGAEKWKSPPPEEAKKDQTPREKVQQSSNTAELQKRSQAVDNVSRQRALKQADAEVAPAFSPGAVTSNTRPMWIGAELFLMRAVSDPARAITGSWIDTNLITRRLLAESRDLLPSAKLLPARKPSADGLVLASFPFRLDPGPPPRIGGSLAAPIALSLIVGWFAVALSILAASLLVFGIMRLSERRASFVSAVTHELRTPLTTFRLYSDMLESNAVKPEKRGDYLRVLSREADRLSHLVENVLAFSRIERGSARSAVSSSTLADLLGPMRDRFEARLATAGMTLKMPLTEPAAADPVRLDAAAIEHILFNLVDNAAKYAAPGTPPVLEISIRKSSARLEIHVADHGPGIPASEHRRIFRAFHKSAREAAETRPGVGLGLALSRRLARGLGGDLTCAAGNPGAVFVLSLPGSRSH